MTNEFPKYTASDYEIAQWYKENEYSLREAVSTRAVVQDHLPELKALVEGEHPPFGEISNTQEFLTALGSKTYFARPLLANLIGRSE